MKEREQDGKDGRGMWGVRGWERETIPGVEGLLQSVAWRDEMGKTFARALAAGVGAELIHKGPMPECALVIASSM